MSISPLIIKQREAAREHFARLTLDEDDTLQALKSNWGVNRRVRRTIKKIAKRGGHNDR